jgi:predicted amidohydrolase YtcJ
MYVVGSVFRERRPSRVDSVVNLDGRFVVPPFGDAHQHLFDPAARPRSSPDRCTTASST